MNRVDVLELVVDLDVDLVDVDLAVSLCDGPRSVLFSFGLVAPTCFIYFLEGSQSLSLCLLALFFPKKVCKKTNARWPPTI